MFTFKALLTTLVSVVFGLTALSGPVLSEDAPKRAQASEKDSAAGDQSAKQDDVDERDYYTRRAQDMLNEDKARDSKPHALAKNYPEHFVVVCEGGCKNRQAHIVDFEPRKKKQPKEIGEMIPTAAGGASPLSKAQFIECIGGCPNGDSVYFGPTAVDNDWESTSQTALGRQGESGRWLSESN